MRAKSISLLTVALIASITTSAVAAPGKKILIPAPPPVAGEPMEPAPVAPNATKPAQKAAGPDLVGLTPQFVHVSHWAKQQRYTDDVALKPYQEKLQLRMLVNNGVDNGAPGFSWFRVKANGEVLFTQDALKGKREGVVDVTGAFPPGANQVVIEAAGVDGATLTWQLATPPMKVVSVEPKNAAPGDTIIVRGTNFPSDVQQANVTFGDAVGDVIATAPTTMKVKIPATAKGGAMTLEANGLPPVTVALGVSGNAPPVVSGVSSWAAPVGSTITIRGKYFNPNASQNQVFFGAVAGQVVSGSDGSLTVVVPSIPGAQGSVPVTVVANGKRSGNSVAFMVGKSATDASYVPQVRQEVKVGAGVTTQNSSQASMQSTSSATESASSQSAGFQTGVAGSNSETQSTSQSGGFSIVNPADK
jgi:hypothetical protein